jgi:uncharacterized phage protein (TIGR01671 family)
MREIKFRAFDSKNKIMEYDVNVNQGQAVKKGYQWFNTDNTVLHSPLMQYTGLKDKNGQEIYEGDIVEITDHPFEGPMSVNGNYEVCYNEQMELCCGSWLLFRMKYYAEVIGNKFENPELLEAAE